MEQHNRGNEDLFKLISSQPLLGGEAPVVVTTEGFNIGGNDHPEGCFVRTTIMKSDIPVSVDTIYLLGIRLDPLFKKDRNGTVVQHGYTFTGAKSMKLDGMQV